MSEITALRKHPCPECGGDAEWNAAKQALACPYCGTVLTFSPGETTSGEEIRDHDLVAALRDLPEASRGWQTDRVSVKCQSCQAISNFDPGRVAQRCEFCGSPSIAPYTETKDSITPESLLPAKLSEPQVRDRLRQWYATRRFAPDRLKKAALTDTLHAIYLPYWTFDALVRADWEAQSGYYYYTTQYFRDPQGRTTAQQVRQIRWEPSAGQVEHFFDDELVAGTAGIHPDLLSQVESFPTGELKPYDPAYVRGWTVERYQIDLRKASDASQSLMEQRIQQYCAAQVPGDTHAQLRVSTRYFHRTFKHILVPIWLVSYTYGTKHYQMLVNGYTGAIAGERPISYVKVFFYIILPLIILFVVFALANS